jgi:hypothetical protein
MASLLGGTGSVTGLYVDGKQGTIAANSLVQSVDVAFPSAPHVTVVAGVVHDKSVFIADAQVASIPDTIPLQKATQIDSLGGPLEQPSGASLAHICAQVRPLPPSEPPPLPPAPELPPEPGFFGDSSSEEQAEMQPRARSVSARVRVGCPINPLGYGARFHAVNGKKSPLT